MAEQTFTFIDGTEATRIALAGANGSGHLAPSAVLYGLDGTQLIGQKARAASLPVALSSEDATAQALSQPAGTVFAVTPSDTVSFATNARSLYVGATGNVVVVAPDDTVATFVAVPAGAILPVRAKRVNTTGTTAGSIVGLA